MKLRQRRMGAVTKSLVALGVGAVTVATMSALPVAGAMQAGAAPVPPAAFTCGVSVFTACNQSAHFNEINQVGSPFTNPAAVGCPSWLSIDYVGIVGTGNSVEHAIINNAGDGWFTSTTTGTVTITAYPPSSVDTTNPNGPVITGPADAAVLPYTGHLTEWFGGAFNKQNQVFGGTVHFSGTAADGTTVSLLDVSHMNSIPNAGGPPHSFENTSC